jgi:hypothetical protein
MSDEAPQAGASTAPGGDDPQNVVEHRDGAFYCNGNEITEDEAKALGWKPPEAPQAAAEGDGDPEGNGAAPPTIFKRLKARQQANREERRTVLAILAGRFDGNLRIRLKPVDPERRKRKLRQIIKINGGRLTAEGDLDYQAWTIAAATETVLIRPEDDFDFSKVKGGHKVDGPGFAPLNETYAPWVEGSPVRWDKRLCDVLGVTAAVEENSGDNLRLVFANPSAMTELYGLVDAWLKESADFESAVEDEDEDGDEDGESVRPT